MIKPTQAAALSLNSGAPSEQSAMVGPSSGESPEPSGMQANNKELFIRKAIEQDARRGCELLFKQYYPYLCSHAIRFVYSREVAEDIVAEVFTNFWQNKVYESFQGPFVSYLYKAVRNRVINYLRWEVNKSKSLEAESVQYPASAPIPDEILQIDELHLRIQEIVASLPPQQRRVFMLSRFEGKKYAEIASELQISVKAVEAHVSKALAFFRRRLKDEF